MTTTKTPDCLIGAGMLGHTWVATRFGSAPGEHNDESIYCQASFGADAVRAIDELGTPGHIYERVSRNKWVKRTRAYALLDQPTDGRKPYEPNMEAQV
jgi:hypothetical protein